MPLGANYRLIDIPVSNCINSNVNKVYCLTQFNSASLNRHLSQAYNANVGGYSSRGFVEVLSSQFAVHLSHGLCLRCAKMQPSRSEYCWMEHDLICLTPLLCSIRGSPVRVCTAALDVSHLLRLPFDHNDLMRPGVGSKPEPRAKEVVPGHSRCSAAVPVAV